jgi:hypothetical protein
VARRIVLALALCMPLFASAATPALGTLFHTPEERERLERLRRGEPDTPAVPTPGATAAVTGFVKRSDGRHTVWIDGAPVTVRGNQAAPIFDTRAVRAYSDREQDPIRIERKTPR